MTLDLSNGSDSFASEDAQLDEKNRIFNAGEKTEYKVENYKFFSFFVNDREFLLPVSKIEEVISLPSLSFLPNANKFIDGAFPLRGSILPAVNMRKISGSPRGEPSPASRLVVVQETGLSFGLIVDRINHVITLSSNQLDHQTHSKYPNNENFCSHAFKNGSQLVGIIELSKLLSLITDDTNLDLS